MKNKFLLIFLLMSIISRLHAVKYTYTALKSKNVSPSFSAASLMKTIKTKSSLMCLAECDQLIDCLCVTYNQQQSDCALLNNTIVTPAIETVPDDTVNVNYKQLSTLTESCVRTECDHRKLLGCFSDACYCDPAKAENTWCVEQLRCARPPRTLSSACTWNCECDATQLLICSGGSCVCDTVSTYNTWCAAQTRCARPIGSFGAACDYNCECDAAKGLVCSGGQCVCDTGNTYNTWCAAQLTCRRAPGTYTASCTYDCECIESQNLFCRSGACNCLNSSFEWKGTKCDWILITTYMTADAKTGWGNWGGEQQCPNRGSAIGFQLRVEGNQGGGDDTALNGIQLACNDSTLITSSVGNFGGWNAWNNCPFGTYLVAFQFRSEPDQGGGSDDTAGNDLYMRCSDGTTLTNTGGMGWGSWGAWFTCSIGRICGIKTLVEYGGGDDTSLNSVQFTCCFP